MLKSMTGFGKASFENEQFSLEVEVKSLNSKFLDQNIRLPREFNSKEIEIRNILSELLKRGKFSVNLNLEIRDEGLQPFAVNPVLFKSYFHQMEKLADEVGSDRSDLFRLAIQSPEVISSNISDKAVNAIWEKFEEVVREACAKCDDFRIEEGKSMERSLLQNVDAIENSLKSVDEDDPVRIDRIKTQLKEKLEALDIDEKVDKSRLEQEMVYYVEKLDIGEEKTRLQSHLDYFRQVTGEKQSQGKKLGFIAQEMGREINTIGSKANDSSIQKKVVVMKDELEKIRELLMNVL